MHEIRSTPVKMAAIRKPIRSVSPAFQTVSKCRDNVNAAECISRHGQRSSWESERQLHVLCLERGHCGGVIRRLRDSVSRIKCRLFPGVLHIAALRLPPHLFFGHMRVIARLVRRSSRLAGDAGAMCQFDKCNNSACWGETKDLRSTPGSHHKTAQSV